MTLDFGEPGAAVWWGSDEDSGFWSGNFFSAVSFKNTSSRREFSRSVHGVSVSRHGGSTDS
jgi:hypothetical protein